MATSATAVQVVNPNLRIWDIIFAVDGDLALIIPHGLGVIPQMYPLTALLPAFYLNSLHVSAVDITNITLTGLDVVGAGNVAAQARLVVMTPHSVMQ